MSTRTKKKKDPKFQNGKQFYLLGPVGRPKRLSMDYSLTTTELNLGMNTYSPRHIEVRNPAVSGVTSGNPVH